MQVGEMLGGGILMGFCYSFSHKRDDKRERERGSLPFFPFYSKSQVSYLGMELRTRTASSTF